MTLRTSGYLLAAAMVVVGLAEACKSSTASCTGTPANLVGTYSLVSYTTGSTTVPAPPAVGELRFYATSAYGVEITLPGPVAIADSGTYSQCGSNGISQSSVVGNPQFRGTYTFVNDTLSVTGTAAVVAVENVWVKHP